MPPLPMASQAIYILLHVGDIDIPDDYSHKLRAVVGHRLELIGFWLFGLFSITGQRRQHLLWPRTRSDYPAVVVTSRMKASQSTRHCLMAGAGNSFLPPLSVRQPMAARGLDGMIWSNSTQAWKSIRTCQEELTMELEDAMS